MQKLTLGWRLGLAFGALILLMCVLGGLAVWRMNLAVTSAADVSEAHTPEVKVAHYVNTSAWETRYFVRSYALTGDEATLRKGRKKLAEVKEHLKTADELGKKFPDRLTALRQGAIDARDKATEFEARLDEVEAEHKNLDAQEGALDAAAKAYMQECRELLDSQQQELNTEIDPRAVGSGAVHGEAAPPQVLKPEAGSTPDPAKLKERLAKTGMVRELIDLGLTIQLNNFKAQAQGDMDALRNALKDFVPLERAIVGLEPIVRHEKNIAQLRKIREFADNYKTAIEQVLKSRSAIDEHTKDLFDTGTAITDKATTVADGGLQTIEKAATEVADGLGLTSAILIGGLVAALIVGVLIAWLSTRAITRPIRDGVNVLAATATEVSATVSQLASSASEAATAVAETTTTVEEIRQTAQVAADKAKAVADSAQGAARAAEAGRQTTDQTVDGLNRIRAQMESIGESITRLNEQSQAVGDIVSTVADLAEQSNLLAVNASIEAAKAGDQGKGFAVVAQEIRSLAEQSKDSTKQVRTILTEVQKATGKAVLAAEQGGKIVADGSKQAEETGQAIRALTGTVQEATRSAMQIAASSQQQLAGMEQVTRAMDNIRQATAQNAEGAKQLAAAAHSLQEVGTRLKALVDAGGEGAGGKGQ